MTLVVLFVFISLNTPHLTNHTNQLKPAIVLHCKVGCKRILFI